LKTFSKKEFKEFEVFINSPAQIKKRDVSGFFKVIKEYYPIFDQKLLEEEKIYRKMFPGRKFEKSRLALAYFHLFDTACEYLIRIDRNENKIERAFSLMHQFIERNMPNAFLKMAKKMDDEISSTNLSLDNYFFYRYRYDDLIMTFHMRRGEQDKQFKAFHSKINASIGLYILRYLRGIPNIPIAQSVYKVKLDTSLTDAIVSVTDIDRLFKNPEIHPYLKILETSYFLYKGLTDTEFEKWTRKSYESFFKNISLFDQNERTFMARSLMNLYVNLIRVAKNRKEREKYSRMQLELVKSMLKYGLTKNKKDIYMQDLFFRNTVCTALDIREYDWAEKFIRDYTVEIKPSNRENLMNYCVAMLEFDRENFDKSLEHLSTVKYDGFYYKTDVRFLLMLLYYELKLFEEAHYMLDTTKKYLKTSSDFNEDDRSLYTNFVSHYGKLLKYHDNPDKLSIEMELEIVKNENEIIEYSDWFIKKFKGLL
jgi:hypothetical protein